MRAGRVGAYHIPLGAVTRDRLHVPGLAQQAFRGVAARTRGRLARCAGVGEDAGWGIFSAHIQAWG